jgi:flagellar motor switch protein FliN/FliY
MDNEKQPLDQEEIERLLQQSLSRPPAKEEAKPASSSSSTPAGPASADQVEAILSQGLTGPSAGGNPPKPSSPTTTAPQPAASDDDRENASAQEDIEQLLKQPGMGPARSVSRQPVKEEKGPPPLLPGEGDMVSDDLEFLLNQAQRALASVESVPQAEPPPGVVAFRLEEFAGAPASTEVATLDLIRDVEMDLRIELGRTHLYLEDVLKLRRGSVVPLDKMAGDPVDIFVNGRLIGRGEVLVLNDSFCVRVAELIAGTPSAG